MIIYFAGSSGAGSSESSSSMSRFKMWIATGIKRKLISYYTIIYDGGGMQELNEMKRINKEGDRGRE